IGPPAAELPPSTATAAAAPVSTSLKRPTFTTDSPNPNLSPRVGPSVYGDATGGPEVRPAGGKAALKRFGAGQTAASPAGSRLMWRTTRLKPHTEAVIPAAPSPATTPVRSQRYMPIDWLHRIQDRKS